jgi:hypothetical protein
MAPTDPQRIPSFPRPARVALALAHAALAALVAACGAVASDDVHVQDTVLTSVAEAYADLAAGDGVDVPLADAGLAPAAAAGPHTVVRRVDVARSVELVDVVVDLEAVPNTATVDAILRVEGTAEIWQVDPDAEPTRTLLGTKPMELSGAVRFDLERRGRAWLVTGVRRAPLEQGPDAADLGPWTFAPASPVAGWPVAVTLEVEAPQPEDRFVVRAHARFLDGVGVLNDAGLGADAVAGDGTYSALGRVERWTREGVRLAFFSALNHTATTDLSVDEDGAYVRPYTETILPAWAYVRAAD